MTADGRGAVGGRAGCMYERYGSAKTNRSAEHQRPAGLSDDTVAALGKLSEALEVVEHARGLLYGFHRLSGTADLTLQEAVAKLRAAGHEELAEEIDTVLVGRDVVGGTWTFQLVESYDANYWAAFRDAEKYARDHLGVEAPHVFEAEMKEREQRDSGN